MLYDTLINTVSRSPFFKDIILTVGSWSLSIFKEGLTVRTPHKPTNVWHLQYQLCSFLNTLWIIDLVMRVFYLSHAEHPRNIYIYSFNRLKNEKTFNILLPSLPSKKHFSIIQYNSFNTVLSNCYFIEDTCCVTVIFSRLFWAFSLCFIMQYLLTELSFLHVSENQMFSWC